MFLLSVFIFRKVANIQSEDRGCQVNSCLLLKLADLYDKRLLTETSSAQVTFRNKDKDLIKVQ